jgi:hypothetical protein
MRERFQVPAGKLVPASFFCEPPPPLDSPLVSPLESESTHEAPRSPPFEARAGFMTIGTFYHAPNVDSVQWVGPDRHCSPRRGMPFDSQMGTLELHLTLHQNAVLLSRRLDRPVSLVYF